VSWQEGQAVAIEMAGVQESALPYQRQEARVPSPPGIAVVYHLQQLALEGRMQVAYSYTKACTALLANSQQANSQPVRLRNNRCITAATGAEYPGNIFVVDN
jgi:hypothetical protein